jgi:serine/threonine protein phosphatase PrpC
MGSFLDKPVREKQVHEEYFEAGDLHFVSASMQGYRISMEDAELLEAGIDNGSTPSGGITFISPTSGADGTVDVAAAPRSPPKKTTCLFGVFDGHGGDQTAKHGAKRLLRFFLKHRAAATAAHAATARPEEDLAVSAPWPLEGDPRVLKAAFEGAMIDLDRWLSQRPDVLAGLDHSGSTAVTALVTPHHITVANVGDSRAVLCREAQNRDGLGGSEPEAVPLSHDHKPYLPLERKRIEAAGGSVRINRVNGDLAVSRALGDFDYKTRTDIKPEEQAVTARPDVLSHRRDPTDRFLVLACDGVWDVMSNDACVQFIEELLLENVGLQEIARSLLDHCLTLGSRDNMTVVLVMFRARARLASKTEGA